MKICRQPQLALCGVIVLSGALHSRAADSTWMVPLAPVPGSNTLNIAITANGTLDGVPINSTASQTAQLAGTQPLGLAANFALMTQQGTVTGLEFVDGDIQVTNTLNWNLNLGLFIGTVKVIGSNIAGQVYTPNPLSLVSEGTTFALADHELILDGGTLSGSATGIAASFLTPFTNDLATDPIEEPVATNGNGTVALSSPTVVGSTASYAVTVVLPVNSSYLFETNPVDVTIAITGTTRWQGTLTRLLVQATNLAIMAAGPASFKVSGLGGASQPYGLYASTNLAAPMTNWWLIGATNADAGGVIQFLDTQATNTQRFYRFGQ